MHILRYITSIYKIVLAEWATNWGTTRGYNMGNNSSAEAQMGDCLAKIDMGRKRGGAVTLSGRGWAPSNTIWPGSRSTTVPSGMLIHPSVWPQQTWAKNWRLCPFWGGVAGPHLTQCGRGLPACQVSSWSIQPFGHNTPTSQTGQTDNGLTAQGEPFYK